MVLALAPGLPSEGGCLMHPGKNSPLCGSVHKADCKLGIVDNFHSPLQPEHIIALAL